MTPETIRTISQLRHEFYSLFAASLSTPVNITNEKAYSSNLSRASWIDAKQQLNYVCIYAYTAPDALVPERPFILRVAINRGADVIAAAKRGKGNQGLNRKWQFELTLLPEELLEFLPWVVGLVKFYDRGAALLLPEPPCSLDLQPDNRLSFHSAWTPRASDRFSQRIISPSDLCHV
ncbi:hypothetical protein IQ268_28585 [Oculatella sp. LEGE 06141]|uniref:hypothetical protein n=1 Tax=Oculatella sp. LEGE 06141 TaxID=1828648 RepID=UPI0018821993|nr:hypothetical protein [Oculatella sp. LEGE 06141]MBE9182512.1 hypothetical protein [Oculatella sp. LEGE 06141]